MAEIGLFPLDTVLLPTEKIPLHIFEPRYRDLIGECLESGREFGLVLADDEGRREIGTTAAVVELVDTFDDGRMNVVVEGRERFRVVEETSGRSFDTAEIELVPDDDLIPPEDEDVDRARALFRKLLDVAEAEVDEPEPDAEPLSFQLGARIDFGNELKQELLELTSERERLERLRELLEKAIEALSVEREVRDRAAGNGKVSPREP